jgi:hypothetical protein
MLVLPPPPHPASNSAERPVDSLDEAASGRSRSRPTAHPKKIAAARSIVRRGGVRLQVFFRGQYAM